VLEAVANDQRAGKGHEGCELEAEVCGEGLGAQRGEFRAALQLDAGPAAWDGQEEVGEGEDVEKDGEEGFLTASAAAFCEGVGVAVEDLAFLPGGPACCQYKNV
jgi:hypothetical protein